MQIFDLLQLGASKLAMRGATHLLHPLLLCPNLGPAGLLLQVRKHIGSGLDVKRTILRAPSPLFAMSPVVNHSPSVSA